MTNTVNLPEVTLAQLCDSTHAINTIGAGGRLQPDQIMVVRVTDHATNDATEVADDTDTMAIFESRRYGAPWVCYSAPNNTRYQHSKGTPPNDASEYWPDFDYSTFE